MICARDTAHGSTKKGLKSSPIQKFDVVNSKHEPPIYPIFYLMHKILKYINHYYHSNVLV